MQCFCIDDGIEIWIHSIQIHIRSAKKSRVINVYATPNRTYICLLTNQYQLNSSQCAVPVF